MPLNCPSCQSINRDSAVFCMTCGRPLALTPGGAFDPGTGRLLSGTLLDGRYRVDGVLGGGGMGTVYLAADTRLGNLACAVKEMTDAFSAASDRQYAVQRFQDEALMLAQLSHPRIPRVTNHFVERGRYYLVMDYVEGENLELVLGRDGRPGLPEPLALDWTLQILDILTYLHAQQPPVIFRDLKPANIMRRKTDGSAALIDFGIARLFVPSQTATMIGTPGYAPPEQYQGLAQPGSDLYAMAATLHHLLTGRDPRKGTPFTFPSVYSLNASLTAALDAVVAKALSLRVEDRFASAQEMTQALRTCRTPGTAPLLPQAAVSLRPIAPDNLEQLDEIACLTGHQGGIANVAFSPDGCLLASAAIAGDVRVWEVASFRELWRVQHGASVRCLAFHPDGRYLASGGVDGFLRLWEVGNRQQTRELYYRSSVHCIVFSADGSVMAVGCENGQVLPISKPFERLTSGGFDAHSLVWSLALSSTGRWLAAGCEDGTVSLWQPGTSRKVWSLTGSSADVFAVAISPDDRLVASAGDDGAVRVWDLSSGREEGGFDLEDAVESVAFSPDGRVLAACGHDNKIWLWEVAGPGELWYLEGHTDVVTQVVFSPDGRLLASASDDTTVRLWGVPTK